MAGTVNDAPRASGSDVIAGLVGLPHGEGTGRWASPAGREGETPGADGGGVPASGRGVGLSEATAARTAGEWGCRA